MYSKIDYDSDDIDMNMFGFPPFEMDDDIEDGMAEFKKKQDCDCKKKCTECVEIKSNQGRDTCYKCGGKTKKIASGMFSTYDVCPRCKV